MKPMDEMRAIPHGRMPALFVGHGSPMNAIEDNEFRRGWAAVARRFRRPVAILCVSAHWETEGVRVTGVGKPQTIHDFYGFPRALFDVRYPAPGDPALARRVIRMATRAEIGLDPDRGLDHGCWSVLRAMYPEADVPVVQLSLDRDRAAKWHYALAADLARLRDDDVLVLASGNIVHNLAMIDFTRPDGEPWAERFNEEVKVRILARDHPRLIDVPSLTPEARLAVPSPEHYLPLLYALAMRADDDTVTFFNDATVMASISMTSVAVGALS